MSPRDNAKAKIIVEGVIADAQLNGDIAKTVKYETVRLARGDRSTGGRVNNGYRGRNPSHQMRTSQQFVSFRSFWIDKLPWTVPV